MALQSRLAPFIANPDLQTDVQARGIRVLSVPEYYHEYRDTGNGLAGFLGASIVAKVSLLSLASVTMYSFSSMLRYIRSYSTTLAVKTSSQKLTMPAKVPIL